MKFKFIGKDGSFCMELVAYNIKSPHGDYLFNGDIIEVPDNLTRIIPSLQASVLFEEVKTTSKSKNDKKKKDKEDN